MVVDMVYKRLLEGVPSGCGVGFLLRGVSVDIV